MAIVQYRIVAQIYQSDIMKTDTKEVKFKLDVETFKILEYICTSKGISKGEYIKSLLDNEFSKIDKTKLADVMAELEKL